MRAGPVLALWPRYFRRRKAVGLATVGLSRAMRFARQPASAASKRPTPPEGRAVRCVLA